MQAARQALMSHLRRRGIHDQAVLAAIGNTPREQFVPAHLHEGAYEDRPLPIGMQQTISQPYVVALMTQALALKPADRVLEIGTGSGYQAAILSQLAGSVYSIEIVPALAVQARQRLNRLGYRVRLRTGDGYQGWPQAAPFDAIMLTAAPDHVPPALLSQLAPGGRLILPLGPQGPDGQMLRLIHRRAEGDRQYDISPVRFVPMTGAAQR